MKAAAICLVALLLAPALWPAQACAADAPASRLNEEMSKQDRIYQSRGEQRPDGYVIDRSLLSYSYTLSAAFVPSLAGLGAKDRWLDIGAGRGQAVLDYFAGRFDALFADRGERRGGKAQVIAMSIEDRRTPLWQQAAAGLPPEQMRYLAGRRLREYAPSELGQFQLITDVIGGFSYTPNLSQFVEFVLGLLVPDGSFYTVLQDVRSAAGTNKPHYEGASFLTEITAADGSQVSPCTWLKSIACAKVACEFKPDRKPPIEVYQVRKVCSEVRVPALTAMHYEAGTPPERRFRLAN